MNIVRCDQRSLRIGSQFSVKLADLFLLGKSVVLDFQEEIPRSKNLPILTKDFSGVRLPTFQIGRRNLSLQTCACPDQTRRMFC